MTDQKNNSTHIASQTTEVSRNAYRNMGESQEVLLLKPHLTMTRAHKPCISKDSTIDLPRQTWGGTFSLSTS